jgi:hypothetical protein
MRFCGNFVELVEEHEILEDTDFIRLSNSEIENQQFKTASIDVYIEKQIILELEEKPLTLVDVALGEVKGEKLGMLFIKKDSNVYGL